MDYYKTIGRDGTAEFKDRGSRFLAYAFGVADAAAFKARLEDLKKEHPKAAHHCFAYRLGIDGALFRVSDDGEPSGSAGRPILGQIDSRGITQAAVVVVRYFGGTLLGVPGLIHAYKTAAALALQVTPVEEKAIETPIRVTCSYPLLNDVMQVLKAGNASILRNEQSLFCTIDAGIPRNRFEQTAQRLGDLFGVEWEPLQS